MSAGTEALLAVSDYQRRRVSAPPPPSSGPGWMNGLEACWNTAAKPVTLSDVGTAQLFVTQDQGL